MQAHKDGILSKNPFLGCKAQKIDYEPRVLSWENYRKIEECRDNDLSEDVLKAKKWFLILCNTGLAHVDLKSICTSIEKVGNEFLLRGARQKSKVKYNVWLRPIIFFYLAGRLFI